MATATKPAIIRPVTGMEEIVRVSVCLFIYNKSGNIKSHFRLYQLARFVSTLHLNSYGFLQLLFYY